MANYRAISNGNWSNLAIWQDDGGGSFVASTVLPGTSDDVYSNNFVININQNVSALSIRNQASTGISAGGGYEITGSYTIQALAGVFSVNSHNCLRLSVTANISIVSNITSVGTGIGLILGSGSGGSVINITGNITSSGTNNGFAISNAGANNTITITGDLLAASTLSATIYALNNTVASTITVNGSVTGSSGGVGICFFNSGPALITVNGSVSSGLGAGISNNNASAVITVNGFVTGTNQAPAIDNNVAASLHISGSLTNGSSRLAIRTIFMTFDPLPASSWAFKSVDGITDTYLYGLGTVLGFPLEPDVREGTTYGPASELEGTLIVPDPSNVRNGVPTDNTTGTAQLTAEDILEAIELSANPVAERLRNVSTVQITGDQIAALNPLP